MQATELIHMGVRADRAAAFAAPITAAMAEFDIGTPIRQAAFLAQILHESGMLKHTRELWGPTPAQLTYERDPASDWRPGLPPGHRNRKPFELGNSQPGDGFRYRGRGLIQITGRANYAATGQALGLDLIRYPESLEAPLLAARSAAWWWQAHGLNTLADQGATERISRRINGGTNGLRDRLALYQITSEVLA